MPEHVLCDECNESEAAVHCTMSNRNYCPVHGHGCCCCCCCLQLVNDKFGGPEP